MTAGDKGVELIIGFGGEFVATPGSTAVLLAKPGTALQNLPIAVTGPIVISSDGLGGIYTTTGTDFQIGGKWTGWARVTTPQGLTITSEPSLPDEFFINLPP